MAWTDHTWVTGETITAALLNGLRDDFRFLHDQGSDIVAAATIAPTLGFHKVTGNTQINNITPPVGGGSMELTLWFTGTPVLKHLNGGTGQINLHPLADYTVQAGEMLTFRYDTVGQVWYETGPRSPIFSGAAMYNDSNQTITTGSHIPLVWNAEDYDVGGFHDNVTLNTRVTIPTPGKYALNVYIPWQDQVGDTSSARIAWTSGASTKYLRYFHTTGNINAASEADQESIAVVQHMSMPGWQFAAADYIVIEVRQRSGGDRVIGGRTVGANPALGPQLTIQKVN